MNAWKASCDVKTMYVGIAWDKSDGNLFTGQTTSGVKVAWTIYGRLYRTTGTILQDVNRKVQDARTSRLIIGMLADGADW